MSWPTSLPASRRNHNSLLLTRNTTRTLRLGCAFLYAHVDSAGNASEAKRCSLLFPCKQPLVCMGLEEAMSWRSVVTCCKSCSSCFPMCPRRFSRKRVQGEALFIVVSLAATLGLLGLEEAMSWRSVVPCCKSCSSYFPMCPRRFSRKRVRSEALLLVVSLAAALDLHGPRRGNILAKRCSLL